MTNFSLSEAGGLTTAVLNSSQSTSLKEGYRMNTFQCLLCGQQVATDCITEHKRVHTDAVGYGILWPPKTEVRPRQFRVPTYEVPKIARAIGVHRVFIRDEGANPSGSMKDYSVERAVDMGTALGKRSHFVW